MPAADVFDSATTAKFAATTIQQTDIANAGLISLMEMTRLGHQAMIDQRSAMAIQEARTSAQSREVLQTQAALNAPRQTAPAYVPEATPLTTAK